MSDPAPRDPAFVQSLERGLAVLRALNTPESQTLSEVAKTTGLSRAAARRFLLTLDNIGYVEQRQSRFSLTPKVLELGHTYLTSLGLPEVAQPHLERLVRDVQESSSVSILDDTDILYVARVHTRRIMTVSINVGTRFPAWATSMGRVLIADMPADERAAILDRSALEDFTPSTVGDRAALEKELDKIARQGYAIVDQELEIGLRSVAAPIRRADGKATAAVNLSVQAATTSVKEIRDRLVGPLIETAEAISGDLEMVDPSNAED
ncbi:MAG TPA: IclR family transcriptional regulator C-terminal domain-containing protein [Solirubrobacterales bacterium]|nr:IclR family transcriptional regulator C-terminal domain-containing protein [Solirubrobacterales bacterium]